MLLTINDRATGMLKMAILESKEAALVQAKAVELLADWNRTADAAVFAHDYH